jgi:hypothetical protein
VSDSPVIAEYQHEAGVPIRIQQRLREAKINVRRFPGIDELRGDEMETLIPYEGHGLRIDQKGGGNQDDGRSEKCPCAAVSCWIYITRWLIDRK